MDQLNENGFDTVGEQIEKERREYRTQRQYQRVRHMVQRGGGGVFRPALSLCRITGVENWVR